MFECCASTAQSSENEFDRLNSSFVNPLSISPFVNHFRMMSQTCTAVDHPFGFWLIEIICVGLLLPLIHWKTVYSAANFTGTLLVSFVSPVKPIQWMMSSVIILKVNQSGVLKVVQKMYPKGKVHPWREFK